MVHKILLRTVILALMLGCSGTGLHAQIMKDYPELFLLSDQNKRKQDSVYYHWTTPNLTVKIDTAGMPPHIGYFAFVDAAQHAVDQWSQRLPSRITMTYGGVAPAGTGADTSDYVCTIFWGDSLRDQDKPIEYVGENVWGYAIYHYHVPSNTMIDGDVLLNPHVKLNASGTAMGVWSTGKMSWNGSVVDTSDLESIIVHELGHILGHDHGLLSSLPGVSPSSMADNNEYYMNWKMDSLQTLCMRTLNYDDWRGICYQYGDTLRVPNVYFNIEEAFDFLQPGQSIVFGKGLHPTSYYNIDTLATSRVLGAQCTLYMMDSTKLVIADTLIVERGARIVLKSDFAANATASLAFAPGGVLIIRDSLGLQGIGHLTDPHIVWQSDFHLPAQDSLAFIAQTRDCEYDFASGTGAVLDGALSYFSHAPSLAHRFNDCWKGIELRQAGALLEAQEGTQLVNVPNIQANAGTRIISRGAAGSDSVRWAFRDSAALVSYGTVDARYTSFSGYSNNWAGMIGVGDSAAFSLDRCSISGILTDPSGTRYAAVSFIGTGNTRFQRITNCDIGRSGAGKYNVGIYVYPLYGARGAIGSYLLVDSTALHSNWQYGMMNVRGGVQMEHSTISGNMGGIFTYAGTTYLYRNCITGHDVYGLYGQNFGVFTLTSDPVAAGSFNTIADNGSQPWHANVCLKDRATLDGGWFRGTTLCHARNELSQSTPARQLIMSGGSIALMEGTYWGEAPGISGVPFGELDAGQTARMIIADTSCILKLAGAVVNKPDSAQGCAGTFEFREDVSAETSRMLDQDSDDANAAFTEMGEMFECETQSLTSGLEDVEAATPRLASRLTAIARNAKTHAERDAAQYYLAKTCALYGDLASAQYELSGLLNRNPASSLRRMALLLRQNLAVSLRDTAAVEQAYQQLQFDDPDTHEAAIAALTRQIYYRLDNRPAPQRSLSLTDIDDTPAMAGTPKAIRLGQNVPNPVPGRTRTTEITYHIPTDMDIRLSVYDRLGREVMVLVNSRKAAGEYTVVFDAGGLPSGLYFYRIETGKGSVTRKMVVIE